MQRIRRAAYVICFYRWARSEILNTLASIIISFVLYENQKRTWRSSHGDPVSIFWREMEPAPARQKGASGTFVSRQNHRINSHRNCSVEMSKITKIEFVLPRIAVSSLRVSTSFEKPSSLSTDDAILSRTFRRHDDQPEQGKKLNKNKHQRQIQGQKWVRNFKDSLRILRDSLLNPRPF